MLLGWFSEAVRLFHQDLTEHGLADQVVMMQWSEFGRRPGENASFRNRSRHRGARICDRQFGSRRSLRRAAFACCYRARPCGQVEFKVDFREVYATLLDKWLGADSRAVLGAQYPNVGFLV